MPRLTLSLCGLIGLFVLHIARADDPPHKDTSRGDALLEQYFQRQVAEIEASTFAGIETRADWENKRGEYRRQLAEMLGLDPMPQKTPLEPVVTGTLDHAEFTVEKLHFQSLPGLYVTGNLYAPKGLDGPAPAVLYVCGHSRAKAGDVSFGNKTSYQHHGIWFARHGYVCLVIDTLQLGEIEGLHHGTYREGMWWWQSRGYTPAGVEAWNCIRALDYLETRDEVDADRLGVTGRSGGGAYSWWIAALDERIKVAVPVAGIASLRNHLLGPYQTTPWNHRDTGGHDGCIEGHCDCMYFINTYRWDFPMVAALVAPRPLLISNTDKDSIFPLDGVYDVYKKAQKIYALYDATDKLGLQICEGPHKDTQQLRVHAFQWMNKYLKGEEPLIDVPAEKLFEPQELRVFDELPEDQINTAIHDTFVAAAAEPTVPKSDAQWQTMREAWMASLRQSVFRGWPDASEAPPLDVERVSTTENGEFQLSVYEFTSQEPYRLQMLVYTRSGRSPEESDALWLGVLTERDWPEEVAKARAWFPEFMADSGINPIDIADEDREHVQKLLRKLRTLDITVVTLLPRGVGPTAWTDEEKERIQIQRRLALLGQTLDGMRAWDVSRGLQAVDEISGHKLDHSNAAASGPACGWLLAALLFKPSPMSVLLDDFDDSAIFLNARRTVPLSAMLALVAEQTSLSVWSRAPQRWEYPRQVSEQLSWPEGQFEVRPMDAD